MLEEKQWISSEILFAEIEKLLAEGRQAVFNVTGMSMWPFLCDKRDQVIIEKCDINELKVGDIVLFCIPPGRYLLHRITELDEDSFVTTGDGNCHRDGRFPKSFIKARVNTMIRKGKKLSVDDWKWKMVWEVWNLLFPVRKSLLRGLRMISSIKRKLFLL